MSIALKIKTELMDNLDKINLDEERDLIRVLTDDFNKKLQFKIIPKEKKNKKSIKTLGFCGMWKDRNDMKDLTSVEWVNRQREKIGNRFSV